MNPHIVLMWRQGPPGGGAGAFLGEALLAPKAAITSANVATLRAWHLALTDRGRAVLRAMPPDL